MGYWSISGSASGERKLRGQASGWTYQDPKSLSPLELEELTKYSQGGKKLGGKDEGRERERGGVGEGDFGDGN